MADAGRICSTGGGRSAPRGPDAAIAAFAARQRGIVARWLLLRAGVTRAEVDRRIGTLLHPVHAGVYAVGHRSLAPGAAQQAALLAVPDAALAGRTAGAWLELLRAAGPIELVTSARRGIARPGLVVHRCASLRDDEVVVVDGLRCTTPARTACDLAAWHPRLLRSFLNEAERRLVHTGDLRTAIVGRPGAQAMRDVLDHLDPRLADLRSPPEEQLAEGLLRRRPRLPVPHANVLVGGFLVDLHWPAYRLVVQVDGDQDHLRRSVADRDRRMDNELPDQGIRVLHYPARRVQAALEAVLGDIARVLGEREP